MGVGLDQNAARDILLIEDDAGDAGLVRIALRRSRHPSALHHVSDGPEALAFLRQDPGHGDAPRPDLILLDLNLPGRTGHEILADIRADRRIHTIPVIILSTSAAERDVHRAYALGANSYVSKPMDIAAFTAAIHGIVDFWFSIARLPS